MTVALRVAAVASLVSLFPLAARPVDSEPERQILDMLDDFAAVAEALDFDRMLEFYSDDERFHWLEDGRLAYDDRETVAEHLSQLAPLIESIDFEIRDPRVLPLGDDTALVSLGFRERLTWVAGGALLLEGVISALVERTDGGWRFLAGHTSTTTPAEPGPEA